MFEHQELKQVAILKGMQSASAVVTSPVLGDVTQKWEGIRVCIASF